MTPPPPTLPTPGGSPEAIFMLAPLLLLLSQDPLLLTGLEDRMRYFPPVLAVTAFLTTTAVVEVRLGGTSLGMGCGTSCNRQPNVASDLALRHTPLPTAAVLDVQLACWSNCAASRFMHSMHGWSRTLRSWHGLTP